MQNGARLKGWAGPNVSTFAATRCHGRFPLFHYFLRLTLYQVGYGYIKNITFDGMYQNNVDWPIVLDACYFNINSVSSSVFLQGSMSKFNQSRCHSSELTHQSPRRQLVRNTPHELICKISFSRTSRVHHLERTVDEWPS